MTETKDTPEPWAEVIAYKRFMESLDIKCVFLPVDMVERCCVLERQQHRDALAEVITSAKVGAELLREELAQEIAEKDKHIQVCEHILREHAEFGGLFQPGGRFHRRANLLLGGSAVVDGGKWLVAELERVEAELTQVRSRLTAVEQERDELVGIVAGLRDALAGRVTSLQSIDANQKAESL